MFNVKKSTRLVVASGLIISAVLLASVFTGNVAAHPLLGSAQSFAVLGGSTVTNTGPTTVFGDLGVSPGTAVTGFPPGIVSGGAIHSADAVAGQAQADLVVTYNTLAGMACTNDQTGQDLGGLTLLPGVYCFSAGAQLTGTLTLDAVGDPDAVFVIQIGSTLTTGSNASVEMIGGSVCSVFWQVGSSATLGTNTDFVGNIVALTSISLNTGADIAGRALARNGAVTMDTNNVSADGCITVPVPPTATEDSTATETMEPSPTETVTSGPRTPTEDASTATSEATSAPGTPTFEATTIPGTPTSEETTVPGTPTSESTEAPGPPAPGTSTPAGPTATIPGIGPGPPGAPAPVTPTPESTLPATATVEVQITPIDATGTPVAPIVQTQAPATSTSASTIPATAVPVGTVPATATATATATAVTPSIAFPQTGSAGLLDSQNEQLMSTMQLTIGIAMVLLLTGGLSFVIERRARQ